MFAVVAAITLSGSSCVIKEIREVPRCDVTYIPQASVVPEISEEEMEALSDEAYEKLLLRDRLRKNDFQQCREVLETMDDQGED